MCGCLWCAPTGDLACNPGMCPDWESNWQPFGLQAASQSTEPHQPGLVYKIFNCTIFHGSEGKKMQLEKFPSVFFPASRICMYPLLSPLNTLCPKGFHLGVICLELKVPFLKQKGTSVISNSGRCL